MKYALIDMGSNSIRLTVYDLDKNSFKLLFKEKIMAALPGVPGHRQPLRRPGRLSAPPDTAGFITQHRKGTASQ